MDLRWGYDYSYNSHTPYQQVEFTGPVDYRISTLGIDIETPVEWTCEDLQEIMSQDSNSFDTLVRHNVERDYKEESIAYQQILTELLRTESDLETSNTLRPVEIADDGVNAVPHPNIGNWHYHSQLQNNHTNDFYPSVSSNEQPLDLQQQTTQVPELSPVAASSPAISFVNEQSGNLYALLTYNIQPEPSVPAQPAILRKARAKSESQPTKKVPLPSSSYSPPGEIRKKSKSSPKVVEPFVSPKPNASPVVQNMTPKRKCQDSPESTTETPTPVIKQPKLEDPDTSSEAQPVAVPRQSPQQKPDTTWELGPYCTAAGLQSSDFEQTSLPEGRAKLPPEALNNGMISELTAYLRQLKAPRRTMVRFLVLYFDLPYLDDTNPTMVDRLFRRVIAPLLARRNELVKHKRPTATRLGASQPKETSAKNQDELEEFDSAVFVIPDFVTEAPKRKAPKLTQGQQLVELQTRFDAFRRVQRKHNLAFLRQLSRLHTKLNTITHHLSKRIKRKSISKVPK